MDVHNIVIIVIIFFGTTKTVAAAASKENEKVEIGATALSLSLSLSPICGGRRGERRFDRGSRWTRQTIGECQLFTEEEGKKCALGRSEKKML